MLIKAITCKQCGDIVYSRARHDLRKCTCGSVYIAGGFDYTRCGGDPENIEYLEFNIRPSQKTLYKDWANNINKYGLIKAKKNK